MQQQQQPPQNGGAVNGNVGGMFGANSGGLPPVVPVGGMMGGQVNNNYPRGPGTCGGMPIQQSTGSSLLPGVGGGGFSTATPSKGSTGLGGGYQQPMSGGSMQHQQGAAMGAYA